jgi:hypothetical protein
MPKKQVIAIVDDDELAREGTIDLSLTEIVEIFPISNFWPELTACWPEGSCLKPDGSAILLSTVGSMRSRPFN